MPIDPMIARGIEPIGAGLNQTLLTIEALRRGKERDARDDRRNDILMMARNQDSLAASQEKDAAGKKTELEHALSRTEWALQSGNPKEALLSDPKAVAAFTAQGMNLVEMDDEDARKMLTEARAKISAQLGIRPEAGPGAISTQSLPGYGTVVTQGGELKYGRPTPSYAPREPNEFDRYRSMSPEDRALYDQFKGKDAGGDPKAVMRAERQTNDAQNVRSAIAKAKGLVSKWSSGFVGQKLRDQGGTPAFDLNAAVDTVKANIGFDRLQRMREESKTGGALGQVAVQELTMLQATIASLDTAQSPEQLMANLDTVDQQYVSAMRAYEAAMQEAGGAPPAAEQAAEQSADDPLAQYAGQVIRQGGKRYQVMQGADGKYFAQEVQ